MNKPLKIYMDYSDAQKRLIGNSNQGMKEISLIPYGVFVETILCNEEGYLFAFCSDEVIRPLVHDVDKLGISHAAT